MPNQILIKNGVQASKERCVKATMMTTAFLIGAFVMMVYIGVALREIDYLEFKTEFLEKGDVRALDIFDGSWVRVDTFSQKQSLHSWFAINSIDTFQLDLAKALSDSGVKPFPIEYHASFLTHPDTVVFLYGVLLVLASLTITYNLRYNYKKYAVFRKITNVYIKANDVDIGKKKSYISIVHPTTPNKRKLIRLSVGWANVYSPSVHAKKDNPRDQSAPKDKSDVVVDIPQP